MMDRSVIDEMFDSKQPAVQRVSSNKFILGFIIPVRVVEDYSVDGSYSKPLRRFASWRGRVLKTKLKKKGALNRVTLRVRVSAHSSLDGNKFNIDSLVNELFRGVRREFGCMNIESIEVQKVSFSDYNNPIVKLWVDVEGATK